MSTILMEHVQAYHLMCHSFHNLPMKYYKTKVGGLGERCSKSEVNKPLRTPSIGDASVATIAAFRIKIAERCLLIKIANQLMLSMAGCFCLKRLKNPPGFEKYTVLASETAFTLNEVEALYNLFQRLSSSLIDDGLIHKEEFEFALLNGNRKPNFFADRLFELFDLKQNGVIEFGEFVRALSIFHPRAAEAEKIAFAFRLYDLRQTGYIERVELKEMVVALLNETDMPLPEEAIEAIVDKTIQEADLKGDGKIDPEEWEAFVARNPAIMRNMTLPYLKEITVAFPSFVLKSKVSDSELVSVLQEESD